VELTTVGFEDRAVELAAAPWFGRMDPGWSRLSEVRGPVELEPAVVAELVADRHARETVGTGPQVGRLGIGRMLTERISICMVVSPVLNWVVGVCGTRERERKEGRAIQSVGCPAFPVSRPILDRCLSLPRSTVTPGSVGVRS
jgi:hypothetical protein